MDALELQKRLWARVRAVEGKLERDTRAFVRSFVEQLRMEGYEIGPQAEQELSDYFQKVDEAVKMGVRSAIFGAVAAAAPSMKSAFMDEMFQDAFNRRWPDGLTLSDRIWWWQEETRRGVGRILSDGIRLGESASRLIYQIQYEIEKNASPFATVTTDEISAWAEELMDAARAVIKNPGMRKEWEETVSRATGYVEQLSRQGTYSASKRLLNKIEDAVNSGREELLESAISWWHYDRQLYFIKRVVRTEMATAQHRGIIRATEDDPDIIGYQWRLSPSHPAPDICDYYAGVDYGLGKGVFPKDKAPSGKAHPQCMCYIIPRVSKVREKGSTDLKGFLDILPGEKRREIMPLWAQDLEGAGVPLERLIRPDGMGFVTKREISQRIGRERLSALQNVGSALSKRQWTDKAAHVKKRIGDGSLKNPRELDRRFERALRHKDTEIWAIVRKDGTVSQYYGLNRKFKEVTVIRKGGVRATWFPLDPPSVRKFVERQRARIRKKEFKRIGRLQDLWKGI